MKKKNTDTVSPLIAIKNALESFNLTGYSVLEVAKNKYLLRDAESVALTGSWNYEQLNHFILGYGKALKKTPAPAIHSPLPDTLDKQEGKNKNWTFRAYHKNGKELETFTINDRTEGEANNEMMHYVESHFEIESWTLTPIQEGDKLEGHTPGPWYLSPNNNYVRANGVHGWNICTIEDQPPYTKANAKLIASAPQLQASNTLLKNENEALKFVVTDFTEALHRLVDRLEKTEEEESYLPPSIKIHLSYAKQVIKKHQ